MSKDKKPAATPSPKILTKRDILGSDDLKRELVEVPEWGGPVYVHTLTGAERDNWEREVLLSQKNKEHNGKPAAKVAMDTRGMKVRLVICCVKDEGGTRIFNKEDLPQLQNKNGKAIDRLFSVAQRLSGLSDDEVEEIAKN